MINHSNWPILLLQLINQLIIREINETFHKIES